jgi:uncharacterized protein (DUF1697 family)
MSRSIPLRSVAFLRAINTPPRHVKMDRLRAVFTSLGFENVATFIASGNVVFDAPDGPDPTREIEAALEDALSFAVPVFLRTGAEVAAVAERAHSVFAEDGPVEVSFLAAEPDPGRARTLEVAASGGDRLAVIGREVYWLRGDRDSDHSEARVVHMLGMPTTRRSARTVAGLVASHLL